MLHTFAILKYSDNSIAQYTRSYKFSVLILTKQLMRFKRVTEITIYFTKISTRAV